MVKAKAKEAGSRVAKQVLTTFPGNVSDTRRLS